MKLNKQTLKRIIKEELEAVLNEEGGADKSVRDFYISLRKTSRLWSRDASKYGGYQVNGFSIYRDAPKRTTAYKMTTGDSIQTQDYSVLLRNFTTIVEVPGVQVYGASVSGSEGKYAIKIFAVAKDSSKSRNSAFNNMGNESYLSPIVSDMQEFPQDGAGFAKTIVQKEKQFRQELVSDEFLQSVNEKVGSSADAKDKNSKTRSALLAAIIELAAKVYGINFKPMK